jgi:hypothetical protein
MLLRDARADDSVDAREIPYRINVAETGALEKSLNRRSLPGPDFHHHGAVGIQPRSAIGGNPAIEVQAIVTSCERLTGFMQANLWFEDVEVGLGDVRRIRNDQVEMRMAVGKEIGSDELDAILASMANRVATRNLKCFFRYVSGFDSHFRRIRSDRNGDRP